MLVIEKTLVVCFFSMVFPFKCLADKYRGQVGENERLQEGHQNFNKIYKYGKCNR